ncbi:MAG: glycosyl hydrolase [Acidobacteriota bacterium]|nr:MAG: glycosyl hydrolase [Acidobacteriota bacterium]
MSNLTRTEFDTYVISRIPVSIREAAARRIVRTVLLRTLLLVSVLFPVLSIGLATETVQPSLLSGMKWRLVGPYRGGRVMTVTGVPGNPQLYYMGATGGGVWKTENAGLTWENISDEFFEVGTIGAIAVANSDPNVIYVGTGEKSIRGVTTSHGNGVYKSTDAGKTWRHVGLPKAGQISRIKIHPQNPDIAYVGVQGQIWGPSEERGVYRTRDGGKTWEQVLKVDPQTGATDLRMDPTNPRILYAAMWEHGRRPWYILSGGHAGGIFKSTDGGDNWKKLTKGLPDLIGKIGVDVSASNPSRLYAIVEAMPGKGGLYRSDDAGENWQLMNGSRILWTRSWYYMHIAADPVDENTVWVLNAPLMKSIDGGATFEMKSTPHGDHHDHWINPQDNKNMINANDGGATITFDGGASWSSIMNQPTAQFYRVNTDNLFPYRIYGGQQDNTTVAILSETYDGGIGNDDFMEVGGGESAHIAFDPNDPRLVYATTINGTLTEYDVQNQRIREIKPYPEFVFGMESKDLHFRTNWNAPVTVSPQKPSVIYYGTEKLLRTTDRGVTFEEISPDLTKNEKDKQGLNGGPITVENVGAEFYGTILTITASPHAYGTVWVGSDDGLVHVTRDDGETWQNVTPGDLGGAMVNSIEVSPFDPGTAYVVVAGYKMNDFLPYIYKLTDYGRNSTRLDQDLPQDNFIRVVREDPIKSGLLYAGGEGGMYISFDQGQHWQSLKLNLPPVPVTDLAIRQKDLVASTQGRGFWVLDDLSALRQVESAMAEKPLHLFQPGPVEMIQRGWSDGQFEGANPPAGVLLNYHIKEESEEPLLIEITDSEGRIVRRFSSEEGEFERCMLANMDQRIPLEIKYPSKEKGAQTWVWDLSREGIHCIEDLPLFEGFSGALVMPGTYTAQIRLGDYQDSTQLTLLPDRRAAASTEDMQLVEVQIVAITSFLNELIDNLAAIRKSRSRIEALLEDYPDADALQRPGKRAANRLTEWEKKVLQVEFETYEDEDSLPGRMVKQVRHLLDVIDSSGPPVSAGAMHRLSDLKAMWADLKTELQAIQASDIAAVNAWARDNSIPHVATTQ